MKIVFAGGGTAGHIMPNIALINQLKEADTVWYFGGNGMEKSLVVQKTAGVHFFEFKAPKLVRKATPANLLLPFKLCDSVIKCKKQLKKIQPDLVFAKGGYVSLPVVWAARSLKIPVICHESDVSVGLANKLCASVCDSFLTTFETTQAKNALRVGCPIRQEIYSANKAVGLATMGFDGKKPVLLFLGGSLGATELNDLAVQIYPKLKRKFDIFVVTGKGKKLNIENSSVNTNLHFCEFVNNIYDCLKASSFCVTRGGANTLCELTALNVPFLTIPLSQNSRGEQLQNAQYFASKGCGAYLPTNVSADILAQKINKLFSLTPLFKQAQRALKIDGTSTILTIIRQITNSR